MKHQRHFDPWTQRQRQISTIWGMLDDLNRAVRLLDSEVAAEGEKLRDTDRPFLTKTLTSRRDKLNQTIRVLEKRLLDLRKLSSA